MTGSNKKRVRIIGAGFSGLSLAWHLTEQGVPVEIFEMKDRAGGLLGTHMTPFGPLETAANSIIWTPHLDYLCEKWGLAIIYPSRVSSRRFIFRSSPRRWPLGVLESLELAVRLGWHFLFRRRQMPPRKLETLRDWGKRILGKAACDFILSPALSGVYASPADRLSATLVLQRFFGANARKERQPKGRPKYRGSVSFAGGMQGLVSTLEAALKAKGVFVHYNVQADIDFSECNVICTNSSHAARILRASAKTCPEDRTHELQCLAELLGKVELLPILTATVFFSQVPKKKYRGFGCLFPKESPTRALGVLMNSYIFPQPNQSHTETWILGGAQDSAIMQLTDSEILQEILKSRKAIFNDESQVLDCRITRWQHALPYYTVDHERIVEEIRGINPKNIFLHGNYLGEIGLSQILEHSKRLSLKLSLEFHS